MSGLSDQLLNTCMPESRSSLSIYLGRAIDRAWSKVRLI